MKFAKVLTIASLLCTGTAALALPSDAAPVFMANNGQGLRCEQGSIARQVRHDVNTGRITPYQANRLMTQDRRLAHLQNRLSCNGLNPIDRARLNFDAHRLEHNVRRDARHDRRFW